MAPHRRWGAMVRARATSKGAPCGGSDLLLVATLNASALEQLAVLLLGHPLAPLLDNRAHDYPRSLLIIQCWAPWAHTTYEGLAYPPER